MHVDYRELRLLFPEYSVRHWIERRGCVVRSWSTDWRGTLVISGQDRAIALCELFDCVPMMVNGAEYFFWNLRNVRMLETPLPHLSRGAQIWQRENGLEPVACAASLCADLREVLQLEHSEPEPAPCTIAPPIERFEFVPAAVSEIGQLAMF